MAFIDDLAKASQLFNQNATGLAVQQRVNTAASQMQEMKTQLADGFIKDAEFRKQSNALARDLQAQLVSVGADANDIQLAFKAIAPQQYGNAQQAFMVGETDLAKATDEFNFDARERRAEADFKRQKELMGMKQTAKKQSPLKESFLTKIDELNTDLTQAESIMETAKSGNLTGINAYNPITALSSDYKDFKASLGRWFDSYRKRITGAGASAQELQMLQKNLPDTGDRDEVFQKKMGTIIKMGKAIRARQLLNRARAGQDVSGFEDMIQEGAAAARELKIPLRGEYSGKVESNKHLKNTQAPASGAKKYWTPSGN